MEESVPKKFLEKYNLLVLDKEPIYSYLKFEKIGTCLINRIHFEIRGTDTETLETDRENEIVEIWSLEEKNKFKTRMEETIKTIKQK